MMFRLYKRSLKRPNTKNTTRMDSPCSKQLNPRKYPERRTQAEQYDKYGEFVRLKRAEYAGRMFLLADTLRGTMEHVIAIDTEMRAAADARGYSDKDDQNMLLSFDNLGDMNGGITFEMMMSEFMKLIDKASEGLPVEDTEEGEESDAADEENDD